MQLGLTIVQFVVAQLVHCFDWELPDGMLPTELDFRGVWSHNAKSHPSSVYTYLWPSQMIN